MSNILIQNANLVDGTGAPARLADVLVEAGKIAAIEEPGRIAPDGVEVIDAKGLRPASSMCTRTTMAK